jgi:hypothetical protein
LLKITKTKNYMSIVKEEINDVLSDLKWSVRIGDLRKIEEMVDEYRINRRKMSENEKIVYDRAVFDILKITNLNKILISNI